ncbi:MAG: CBS domain-containing protein [Nitrospinae bacterium]|nr:CBS domain-containing protein [Nitrospinota bacterium]
MTQDISGTNNEDAESLLDDIGDYMNAPVLSIAHDSTVQEAAQYMRVSNVGSLLIKEYDDFVGIVTETDLTRKVVGDGLNPETTPIANIMTQPVQSMDRFLPVEEANKYMHKNKIRHLAVTENGKIVGMLSIKDLVAYYAKSSFKMQE